MDETGVLNLIDELTMLIEDSKPAFGKNNLRQVDAQAAFEILDEIRDTFQANLPKLVKLFVSVRLYWMKLKLRQAA